VPEKPVKRRLAGEKDLWKLGFVWSDWTGEGSS
jgi:hypothetical protein